MEAFVSWNVLFALSSPWNTWRWGGEKIIQRRDSCATVKSVLGLILSKSARTIAVKELQTIFITFSVQARVGFSRW